MGSDLQSQAVAETDWMDLLWKTEEFLAEPPHDSSYFIF